MRLEKDDVEEKSKVKPRKLNKARAVRLFNVLRVVQGAVNNK
jgi:hypothetical protein